MKALKTIIKEWSRNRTSSQYREKEDLINKLKEFDEATIRGPGNIVVDSQRSTWLENLRNIELKENLDISPKAKVKWGIEADENSKFFHAIVNQKRRALSIHGIKHEGHWLSDPHTIKDTFHSFFESKFKKVDVVMHFMGFSEKWIKWIKGCLYSATSSILINGSPTREFNINCGLRQGDPLSPFIFIIAMEGLHVVVEDALSVGLYRGLKINFHKSNLAGVGVPFEEVNHFALTTGCNAMQSPFLYLGLPVDCNMANTKSWGPIFDKFSKRLSKWKSSLLSIGGRSTLISSVLGAIGTYYFSLFPMPVTVNNKLESLRSNFFWGSDANVKKIPWIS
ncbi:RNA-directed DNA polymerase, eukaryota, reverse transcriptase zinc-binding domain protein [Tanacetum coccineum]